MSWGSSVRVKSIFGKCSCGETLSDAQESVKWFFLYWRENSKLHRKSLSWLSHWSNNQLAINCWQYHSAILPRKVQAPEQYIAMIKISLILSQNFKTVLTRLYTQFSGYFFKISIKLTYLNFLWILHKICLKFNDNKQKISENWSKNFCNNFKIYPDFP